MRKAERLQAILERLLGYPVTEPERTYAGCVQLSGFANSWECEAAGEMFPFRIGSIWTMTQILSLDVVCAERFRGINIGIGPVHDAMLPGAKTLRLRGKAPNKEVSGGRSTSAALTGYPGD